MSESLMSNNDHFDLCVVGAGYAGLNAAFVASQYLPVTARVLVLDKHQQAGGMWNDGNQAASHQADKDSDRRFAASPNA
jgi:cation diffusion facilitator CzcD-associated flavoprotein CzcO